MKNKDLFTSDSNEWYTPQKLFNDIQDWFNIKFTLDPCATKESAKCDKYYTKEDNGLDQDWGGEIVFINPPYGGKDKKIQDKFISKAYEESKKPNTTCILLIPARTETKRWQNIIFKHAKIILFINGRIKFQKLEDEKLVFKGVSTFPSAIVYFSSIERLDYQYIKTFEQ